MGLFPLPMTTPGSEAAGSLKQVLPGWPGWALTSYRWGSVEGRGLLRSFIPSHTGDEDRKYMKGVARTGRSWSPTAHSCVGGVEHQGYRGCRPWELQLGRPSWGRGRWRKNEGSFLLCPRVVLSSVHSDQSSSQPYQIALTLSQVVLLN